MLLAIERVACEGNGGDDVMIVLDVLADQASWYRDNFNFKNAGDTQGNRNSFKFALPPGG